MSSSGGLPDGIIKKEDQTAGIFLPLFILPDGGVRLAKISATTNRAIKIQAVMA
jgi:hypothetical protein